MSITGATIQCVYCRQSKLRPRRGEHIILDALGGQATIRDVCGDCNRDLGRAVDHEFVRASLVGLRRFLDPRNRDGQVGGAQFLPTEFGYLDVRLMNTQGADILPQIALNDQQMIVVAIDSDQAPANEVASSFARTAPVVHREIRDVPEHNPTRLVVDRRLRSHLLRARTEEAAEKLLAALRRGMEPSSFSPWTPPTQMTMRISTDPNVPGRCAAKMAFNMACAVLGAGFMLEERFDPVRDYIMGRNVIEGDVVSEGGEAGLRIDYRFVDPWLAQRPDQRARAAQENSHAIQLRVAHGLLIAEVTLFGGAESFRIRLGSGAPLARSECLPAVLWSRAEGDWWLLPDHDGLAWRHGEPPMWPSASAEVG